MEWSSGVVKWSGQVKWLSEVFTLRFVYMINLYESVHSELSY